MRTKLIVVLSCLSVLIGVAGFAFAGSPATAATALTKGDVLLSIGGGKIEQHKPDGTLVQTLDDTSGTTENDGMCFDADTNLFATNGFVANTVSKFDAAGNLVNANFISTGVAANGHPESCAADSSGNIFVGLPDASPDQFQKFSPTGSLVQTFNVAASGRGTDWLELAADNCTIFYTSEGATIQRYNTCTNTQLADFATGLPGPCYAHRIRPNGEVLVACQSAIVSLSPTGTVLNTFSAASLGFTSGFLFAMNLDPDGSTFWTADYSSGKVVRANISDGSVVGGFNPTNTAAGPYGGLAIVGEINVAIPTTTTTASTSTSTSASSTTAPSSATTVRPVVATPRFTG